MKNKIIKVFAILFAEIMLVFFLSCFICFFIGVWSGGINEGFQLAFGIFYNWFAFLIISLTAAIISLGILFFSKKL
jgi:hypothetical protein